MYICILSLMGKFVDHQAEIKFFISRPTLSRDLTARKRQRKRSLNHLPVTVKRDHMHF